MDNKYHISKNIKDEEKRLSLIGELANKDAFLPLKEIKKLNPKIENILDAGCGTGEAFILLQKVFPKSKITGLDQSEKSIKIAKKRKIAKELFLEDLNNLNKIENKKFDLIFIRNTLLHIKDKVKVLKKLKTLLNKDGIIFLQEPDWSFAKANWKDFENFKKFITEKMESFGIDPYMGPKVPSLLQKSKIEIVDNKKTFSKIKTKDKTWNALYFMLEVTGGNDELKNKIDKAKQNKNNYFITPAWIMTWGKN